MHFVLTFDAYNEKVNEAENNKKKLEETKKQLADFVNGQKEFQKSIEARYERYDNLFSELLLRHNKDKLKKIKDEKKRNAAESQLLWDGAAAAEYELEEELEEKAAQERLAAYDEQAGRNHEFTEE